MAAKSFFEYQAQARRRSAWLLLMFALSVIATVAAIDAVAWLIWYSNRHGPEDSPALMLAWVSGLVLGVVAVSTMLRIATLSAGGPAVAAELGGTLVAPDTVSQRYRRLRNVVEEIAIASGVPVPQIYVMEKEAAINAFAAGYSPADAAITVSRGALDKLSRDELQGVIAHEFSHLLNGDMRLNIRLMGLLFGILMLGLIGARMMRYAQFSGSRRGVGSYVAIAAGLWVFGSVGVFFGRMIKAGVSRSREYLADASAVQFTRQTAGLAGALKKAAGLPAGTQLQASGREEVAHMLFGDGVGLHGWFATHPPIGARIQRLEPDFVLSQLPALAQDWNRADYLPDGEALDEEPLFVKFSGGATSALSGAGVVAQVANPGEDDYRVAQALHGELPADWLAAARDEQRALEVVLALIIDDEPALAAAQLQIIATHWGAAQRERVTQYLAARSRVLAVHRLPLAAVAMPSLRRQPREQLLQLMRTMHALMMADGRVQPFEWALCRLLRDQVAAVLIPASANGAGTLSLDQTRQALIDLYTVVAHYGNADGDAARRAFQAGAQVVLPRAALDYRLPAQGLRALDVALKQLDRLKPAGKALLIEGLVAVLSADQRVTITEAELLRAICGALHCPLPPLLSM